MYVDDREREECKIQHMYHIVSCNEQLSMLNKSAVPPCPYQLFHLGLSSINRVCLGEYLGLKCVLKQFFFLFDTVHSGRSAENGREPWETASFARLRTICSLPFVGHTSSAC